MSRDDREDEIGKKIRRSEIGSVSAYNSQMGRRISFVPPGTLNTITPCAACKLLRRRCAEECPFSPYFSPHEPHKFAAVHKVFGASNVSKLLLEVPESQRADTANSLVYEANLRLRDPVYGCMGVISVLQHQLQSLQAELNVIRADILKYKYREAATHINVSSSLVSPGVVSIAAPPQAISPPLPPRPPPSLVISSSSTSTSTSSLYTPSTNTTGYSSISSDNVPYFD